MKYLLSIVLILGGCSFKEKYPQRYTGMSPIPLENYDEEVLKAKAEALNMRYVDYLHALTNGKIQQLRTPPK